MSSTLWPFRNPLLAWQQARRAWRAQLGQRVSRWVHKRQGSDRLPLTLTSRRLYILPTRVGITFAIVCFSMLLGSMNYNNSMGFALTFLLAATGLVAMHRCHRNLAEIDVVSVHAAPVFAGESAVFDLTLRNPGGADRYELRAAIGQRSSQTGDLAAGGETTLSVALPTRRRGIVSVGRIGLSSRYPLALLRCWSWLYTDSQCRVWPAPAADAPSRPLTASPNSGKLGGGGDEDFAGLRDYRDGDSPRLIAWKSFARSNELKSKRFSGSSVATTWIDLAATPGQDLERRLSVLTRWLLDADAAGEHYGLRLADLEIPPARGRAHRDRCLDAMASYQAPVDEYAG